MRKSNRLRLAAGAMFLAATLYGLLAVPGLVSDRDSIVPAHAREAQR